MVELDQMRDLVRDDIFCKRRWKLHQTPVEADFTFGIAAAPFALGVGKAHRRLRARDSLCVLRDPRRYELPCLLFQPVANARRHLVLIVCRRVGDRQMEQIGNDSGGAAELEVQRKLATSIENRRAGFPFARHDVAASRTPLVHRLDDPLSALGECRLDFTNRHPARRTYRQPIEMHLHADGLPTRADELVVDRLSGEVYAPNVTDLTRVAGGRLERGLMARGGVSATAAQGAPNRATSPSIHDSIACVNCAASLP